MSERQYQTMLPHDPESQNPPVKRCTVCGVNNPASYTACFQCGAALPAEALPQPAVQSAAGLPAEFSLAGSQTGTSGWAGTSAPLASPGPPSFAPAGPPPLASPVPTSFTPTGPPPAASSDVPSFTPAGPAPAAPYDPPSFAPLSRTPVEPAREPDQPPAYSAPAAPQIDDWAGAAGQPPQGQEAPPRLAYSPHPYRHDRADAAAAAPGNAGARPYGAAPAPGWQTPMSGAGPAPAPPAPLPVFGSLASAAVPAGQMLLCGVCGSQIFPGQQKCLRCQTPAGCLVNPNDPTCSTSIPFGPPVPLAPLLRAKLPETQVRRTDVLGGWNWGAALMPTVWAARHRISWLAGTSGLLTLLLSCLYLLRAALHRTPDASGTLSGLLLSCALLFGLPRSLFAAMRGNTLALRSGLYPDAGSLRKAQRSFTVWAIIGSTAFALLLGAAAAMLSAR